METIHPHTAALIRKLESLAPLAPEEKAALLGLPLRLKTVAADQDIVCEGDRPSECCLIVEGFACRYNLTGEGKRQILSFHIGGDIPDLQSLHLRVMDHSLGTLVPSKLAFIQHDALRSFMRSHPRLGDLFWRDTLIDAAVFRQWIVGLGRREARGRIAHLLCELLVRLRAAELVEDHVFGLPVTQAELGDALGISTVHVNRVLQELRGENLISWRGETLQVLDWEGLKQAGEFDPTYLHLVKREAL
ncbi:Crp/Fnr family transcriptional regulator [Microvirga sp. KLBC 81]|uniref:Crp/Fnr family transcriptional regulator n=1 Tax=Microvirga sp. KLBC 81 TaxID=1862707 RepID=UPI000D521E0E|nr:Crp/Fnr family transcriptional regulator [Microvirga sp. KLBC 81]PVE23933.1 Crp/Fnr family transcriptional regulator [Microvirga sp. KLBC 81]